jgi:hypothetical protein
MTYLEYFYILMYITILVVAVLSPLIILNIKLPILQKQNGLATSLLYWPLIIGLLLGITLMTFYPRAPRFENVPTLQQEAPPAQDSSASISIGEHDL